MKHIREILHRTRDSVARLVSDLEKKIQILEVFSTAQSQRLFDLEAKQKPSIHSMEVDQLNQNQNEIQRRSIMSDGDLQLDLQKQYGKTKWAKKLINEILVDRKENDTRDART